MTREDLLAEFWAHHYADKPPGEEFEDDDFAAAVQAMTGSDDWEEMKHDRY